MKFIYILMTLVLFYGCSHEESSPTQERFSLSLSPVLSGGLSSDIPVNSLIIVYASEPLDYATVNAQTVYMQNLSDNTIVLTNVSSMQTPDGEAIALQPIEYLAPNSDYKIIVSTEVATASGEHRNTNAEITFGTGAKVDNTPPHLVSTLPDNTSTSSFIDPYAVLSFQFDEPLSQIAAVNVTFSLKKDSAFTPVELAGTLVLSGSLLSFIPKESMLEGSYTLELNTTNVLDLAGNAYSGATLETLNFTTVADADATPLSDFSGTQDYNINTKINVLISQGTKLLVGTDKGLDVLNYNQNATPKLSLQSHLENTTLGKVYTISVDTKTQHAYIGSSTGFTIVDVSNYSNIKMLSHVDIKNANDYFVPVYGLYINQDHAYLAASSLGVVDLNISDLTHPSTLQSSTTNAPAFELLALDDANLILSSYGNGISKINRGTLKESSLSAESTFSHNIFNRPVSENNFFFSAGTRGIGIATGNATQSYYRETNAYITRVLDRGDLSCAIAKDIGLLFFSSTGAIRSYEKLPFKASAFVYMENLTALGDHVLILSDFEGQLYVEVIPGV